MGWTMMAALRIIALSIGAAVLYGLVHDQITARVCVEYFTIGHPKVIESHDPTLLALVWGVIATWWAGPLIGIALAVACRAGRLPRLDARDLLRPTAVLLLVMGLSAAAAGSYVYSEAMRNDSYTGGAYAEHFDPILREIPEDRQAAFEADRWTHETSYDVGFLGGLVLCAWSWRRRRLLSRANVQPGAPAG